MTGLCGVVRATTSSRDTVWLSTRISLGVPDSLGLGYRANYTDRPVADICSEPGAEVPRQALGPCPDLLPVPAASYPQKGLTLNPESTSASTSKLCLPFASTNSGHLAALWAKDYTYHRPRLPLARKEKRALLDLEAALGNEGS